MISKIIRSDIFRVLGFHCKLTQHTLSSTATSSTPIDYRVNPLKCLDPVPNDLEIALAQRPLPIADIAAVYGISADRTMSYGPFMAKIRPDPSNQQFSQSTGRYVVVTGTTPTKHGEGKTTTTMGLAQALGSHIKVPTIAVIRQPSQGPTFGLKGGAAGGGYCQCIPMTEFNLHLTGDMHAITAANNFLAAAIDSRLYHESTATTNQLFRRMIPVDKSGRYSISPPLRRRMDRLGIKPEELSTLSEERQAQLVRLNIDKDRISWRRAVDINDRALRRITIDDSTATSYSTGFDISPASEIMAVLALAKDPHDLRVRLSRIIIGYDTAGQTITAEDIGAVGALMVMLKDAVHPTMVQTLEGSPVFVHAGPFSNIAHGCSSIMADRLALQIVGSSGYVLTEAGFGSDLGLEKFIDIKCRSSGLFPDAAVLTTTVRALRSHSSLPSSASSLDHLRDGLANLGAHIKNVKTFNLPVVVAINKFATDTDEELKLVQSYAIEQCSANQAVSMTSWAHGGPGAVDLGHALINTCNQNRGIGTPSHAPTFLYPLDPKLSVQDRIKTIATKMYGAADVSFDQRAKDAIDTFVKTGHANLPICMAKTPLSLSHDPNLHGVPKGFTLPILNVRLSAGAGFLVAFCGDIITMPGLPSLANFYQMDLDDSGEVVGMF